MADLNRLVVLTGRSEGISGSDNFALTEFPGKIQNEE
jgi:hypothetical protein